MCFEAGGNWERMASDMEETDIDRGLVRDGVSKRMAYLKTAENRKLNKAETKQRAFRLYDANKSITGIAAQLGVNKSTVSRWINKREF